MAARLRSWTESAVNQSFIPLWRNALLLGERQKVKLCSRTTIKTDQRAAVCAGYKQDEHHNTDQGAHTAVQGQNKVSIYNDYLHKIRYLLL